MTTLVVAQWDESGLKPSSLGAIAAAQKLGNSVHALIFGGAGDAGFFMAQEALQRAGGIEKVLVAVSESLASGLAEAVAPVLAAMAQDYSHIVAATSSQSKDYFPRAAALSGAVMFSDVTAIQGPGKVERPVYAGNLLETIEIKAPLLFLTVRVSRFALLEEATRAVPVQSLAPQVVALAQQDLAEVKASMVNKNQRPELGSARIVVSAGRGLKSKEHFAIIEALADALGAAVGASRAVVDAGIAPNELQVGQTGQVVAPDLYIAVGISGAIQHVAGIKDSKIIVAINKDAQAPIFDVADYGLVGDLFEVVPELTKKIEALVRQ